MSGASAATGSPPAPAYKLPGVNLFASGVYRGKRWPPEVVRAIAENIRRNGPSGTKLLVPPAVLGHEEDQDWLDKTDLPAAGWVDPDTAAAVPDPEHPGEWILRGDVINVPPEVADRIRNGEFANGSGEFYELADDFGKPQGYTMRRFALLGGEVPQVKRLGRLPMPVPMDQLKVFTEIVAAAPKGGAAFLLAFSERQTMDRTAAYAAIKACMPGLSQATLDALSDDQVNELVANLPKPAPAPAPAPTPMGDPVPGVVPAAPSRDDMIAALVAKGGDQAALAAMSDADLLAAYQQAVTTMADPAPCDDPTKKKPVEVSTMSETEKQAAASLKRIQNMEAAASAREKAAADREKKAKTADAEAFCERLVGQGRLLPFQRADYVTILTGLDDTQATHKFSENGKTETLTAFEAKKRELERRPVMVKFGEKIPGGTGDAKANADAEVSKVEKFCEIHGSALRNAGSDPSKIVETAKKMAKSNSEFKASDLIGREAVEMVS